MRLRCGDELFEPRVRTGRDGVAVVLGEHTFPVSLEPVAAGVFLARDAGRARLVHVARDGTRVHLFWDGVAYTLEEEREGARRARAARQRRARGADARPGQRGARPWPARAWRRATSSLVVEAMKMENALRAPRDGTVRVVHVVVGEMVAPGRPLLELEP